MNILLTGATGFLGSALLNRLQKDGHTVTGISEHGNQQKGILAISLLDEKAVFDIVQATCPDIIFHVGAFVDLSREYRVAKECLKTNTIGTLILLEAAKKANVVKMVFASTEEVYGNGPTPYTEDQILNPPSPYAVSKIAAESLLTLYAQENRMSGYIFRIGTMYGADQQKNKFISTLVRQAKTNQEIRIPNAQNQRDYIYVDDVVAAFMQALVLSEKVPLEVINIGSGVATSMAQFVDSIKETVQSHSVIIDGGVALRPNESPYWLMDISKAKRILRWEPKITLEVGIAKMISESK
jgi:nucleoside-diphosphate-sugar epimerase